MSTAQVLFASALAAITLLITFFALYVLSSTMWADRWTRRRFIGDDETRTAAKATSDS